MTKPKRTYPFTEPLPTQPMNVSSGNTFEITNATMTVYKENPFHGWRRAVFAFDEWAHRHDLNDRGPLHLLCDWWDKHLLGDD